MIAPAMNTRPQEVLSYRDLARQHARITRQIGLAELPRVLILAAGESAAPLDVTLTFAPDPDGLVRGLHVHHRRNGGTSQRTGRS
jgi:hypothetical protein